MNGLSFEDSSLHILDHLLLLLSELFVPELHSMDFLLHCDNLALTDVGVKCILHFPFKLDLSLPEEDLSFGFDDLRKDVSLLLL